MTLVRFFLAAAAVATVQMAAAQPSKINYAKQAALYYLHQAELKSLNLLKDPPTYPGEICHPTDPTECMIFVAGSLPSDSERLVAARACIGNSGKQCAVFTAGSLPNFNERVAAAQACYGNQDLACAMFVAGSLPSLSERLAAAQACRMADVHCVVQVAGSLPSFSERVAAAKACGGQ